MRELNREEKDLLSKHVHTALEVLDELQINSGKPNPSLSILYYLMGFLMGYCDLSEQKEIEGRPINPPPNPSKPLQQVDPRRR